MGLAAVVAGLFAAWRWFPTRPAENWENVHVFELTPEECRALRQGRSSTEWVAAPSLGPVTIGKVAEKFGLELPLVCAANQRPPSCGEETVPPLARLQLPLRRESSSAVVAQPSP